MPDIKPLQKVLIANRGEIAVRVIRAARDAGIGSVAVYAEPDANALFVRLADEAYSLEGSTPADSYLVIEKIIDVAKRSGADSVHPGYGFLAENANFAQAVLDAGLVWIGPSPAAIDSLGDKAKAKQIALAAGAPLARGLKDPVENADEIVAFANEHGLPVAIKAVFGGGGRGLKVARTIEEIPDAYESAVREAVTAFGRGAGREPVRARHAGRPTARKSLTTGMTCRSGIWMWKRARACGSIKTLSAISATWSSLHGRPTANGSLIQNN